jgi:hypothetical protein
VIPWQMCYKHVLPQLDPSALHCLPQHAVKGRHVGVRCPIARRLLVCGWEARVLGVALLQSCGSSHQKYESLAGARQWR